MVSKNSPVPNPGPDQMEMFGVDFNNYTGQKTLTLPEQNLPETPTVSNEPYVGPTTDIKLRREHVQEALNHLAQANQRAPISAGYSNVQSDLESRYGNQTGDVIAGADFNRQRALEKAKSEFRRGFGEIALKQAGVSAQEVKALTEKSYSEFETKFLGSHNRSKLLAERKKLAKAERIRQGKRR